jgi:phosphate-selective porin OprO/OprP
MPSDTLAWSCGIRGGDGTTGALKLTCAGFQAVRRPEYRIAESEMGCVDQRGKRIVGVAAGLALVVSASNVAAGQQAPPDSSSTAARLAELEGKIRKLEDGVAEHDSAAAPPTLVAGREGFALRSADGDFVLRLRGYFQSDARVFVDDAARPATSTILARRIRPVFEGTLWKFVDFRFMPDFGEGRATLFDAYVDLRVRPAIALRVGKFKPPVGLERLQSATDLLFVERGFPTNLVPSRDLGAQLHGEIGRAAVSYALGLFNGAPDLGNQDGDNGDDKDVAARVFVQPFRGVGPVLLRGLGLGVAVSTGVQRGAAAAPFLPGYRSPAQQTVFAYRADGTEGGTALATGRHTRWSPQGYFYAGPFGLFWEYVRSSQDVRRDAITGRLSHDAWQVAGTWVLTGERASYRAVEPRRPFNPGGGGWGALSIAARYGVLLIDADAFPLFADPASQVQEARAWGLALNWFLARGLRLQVNYDQTGYTGGAGLGDRPTERAVLARVQHAF